MTLFRTALVAALASVVSTAHAVPGTVQQQGRLLDGLGAPQTGAHDLHVSIYDQPTGGSLLWTETHTVTLDGGYYSVALGTGTPLDSTVLDGTTRYLQIQVDTDPALAPRTAVMSVPYAVRADTATSVDGGSVNGSTIQVGGNTIVDSSGNLDVNTADVGALVVGGSTVIDTSGNLDVDSADVGALIVGGSTIIDGSGNLDAGVADVAELKVNGVTVITSAGEFVGVSDTLAGLTCAQHQIARFDGTNWVCAAGISVADVLGNRNITVTADNTHEAALQAYGDSGQGTGRLYVGQDASFGGGVIYDGDGTPDVVGQSDYISLYRRTAGVDSAVLDFRHDNGDVRIYEDLNVNGSTAVAGAVSVGTDASVTGDADVGGTLTVGGNTAVNAALLEVGNTVAGTDNVLRVRADSSHTASVEAYGYGGAQGGGRVYAGQSGTHGGGFSYDGDSSPDLVGGSDRITHFRRTDDGEHEVFSFAHSNDDVDFTGHVTRKAPFERYDNPSGSDATVIDVAWGTSTLTSSPHVTKTSATGFTLNTPGWYRVHARFLLERCDHVGSFYRVFLQKNGGNVEHGSRFTADQTASDNYYSVDNTFTVYSDGTDYVGIRVESGSSGDTTWGIYSGSSYDSLTLEYLGD